MKLYDLGKNHCDYFNQFIPNPAQPEPKPDEESRDEGVGSEKQNDQIQNTGSIIASTGKYTIHCLTVIGQIEGHICSRPIRKPLSMSMCCRSW